MKLIDHHGLRCSRLLAVSLMILIDERGRRLLHQIGNGFQHSLLIKLLLGSRTPDKVIRSLIDALDLDLDSLEVKLSREDFLDQLADVSEQWMWLLQVDIELFEELREVS